MTQGPAAHGTASSSHVEGAVQVGGRPEDEPDGPAGLAKHLENRDFVPERDTQYLRRTADRPQRLGREMATLEPKRREVLRVVRRVRNRLEAQYESKLQAKKLFAAQREECPPQYRHLVNKYYEALSQANE